ncbi:MAG: alpha-amylase family glycosyl hydrolase [Anaerolineales bacterium]
MAERIHLRIREYKTWQGRRGRLTERDALLIVYPDQLNQPDAPPLRALRSFCEKHLKGVVSSLHLLPFFPYSSDDGFAVINYREVKPELGTWEDVRALGDSFCLMFDLVINHISSQSHWFQAFLQDDPRYKDYFTTVEDERDLSAVTRPRTTPLVTNFSTSIGSKRLWTTFSRDQIDLNYRNPDVLLEMIDVLLFYVGQGAQIIRLDAIAYLWKEIGTPCVHLPQTHRLVQLLRSVLDLAAPEVMLITETNVPHPQNVTYFGDGLNEAQLVYNFALPPLVLHALLTESSQLLAAWLVDLDLPSGDVTFLNYLASHDGVGLSGVRGILPESEIDWLIDKVTERGGLVSYKRDAEGEKAYELNVNYFDALGTPGAPEPESLHLERFITAHAIILAIRGVPALYFHSLFGSRGWPEGVQQIGHNRAINRQKLPLSQVEFDLADPTSLRSRVFSRLSRMLQVRRSNAAFHPSGPQKVVEGNDSVLALLRTSPSGHERVLCLHNVSGQPATFDLDPRTVFGDFETADHLRDILSGGRIPIMSNSSLALGPYETLWLGQSRRNP